MYQNNGKVSASQNLILIEFTDTGHLLVFGRRDVQAEAKGESFAHRCRWWIGGQSKTDIVPFATSSTSASTVIFFPSQKLRTGLQEASETQEIYKILQNL